MRAPQRPLRSCVVVTQADPSESVSARSQLLVAALLLGVVATSGCGRATGPASGSTSAASGNSAHPKAKPDSPVSVSPGAAALVFRAEELPFRYERGESGVALPVETTGGGVGMLDFDGDGDLDLFFAQGIPLNPKRDTPAPADVLLRNDGGGRFVDISTTAGLTTKGYGQGVAVADYDADGDPDVYVTRFGANTLWRNDSGRFTDVTAEAGVGCELWSLGAAFFDFDGDSDLDLFVANYFDFDRSKAPFHRDAEGRPEYGPPADFPGLPDVLYRNEGNGRFVDVTARAGVAGRGRGMGVLAADFDLDGRMDVFVANDAEANALWRNKGDGTFEDVAGAWGVAVNGQGATEANMGIARNDTDGDGNFDLLVTHFFGEHDTLWRSKALPGGGVYFQDETFQAGLGTDSVPYTGWGTDLADFDQDGRVDLIVTNGHIRREPHQRFVYENPPILWRNSGHGRYTNVTQSAGPYFQNLHMGRGLACGDLDGDGDLDVVVVHHRAPSVVLWNETPRAGHWLIVDLKGSGRNRDAIGARLSIEAGRLRQVRSVDGGGSYISAHDRRLHIGLGATSKLDKLEVRWPSGRTESRAGLQADQVISWNERP